MKKLAYKKYCLVIISFVLVSIQIQAQNGWTLRTTVPQTPPRSQPTASVVDGKIYVIGGMTTGFVDVADNDSYDPINGIWDTNLAPIPTPRSFTTSAVVNGIIYVIGGGYPTATNKIEAYNPLTNTWDTTLKDMPGEPRLAMRSDVIDGIIYVVGGNYFQNDCYAYDPSADTWDTLASIPVPDGGGALSVTAYNGLIYTFGGSSNASTQLLDEMHYRGMLRVVRRVGGTRVYGVRSQDAYDTPDEATSAARMDALIDIVVAKYAPLPSRSLGSYLSLLCGGVPQWRTKRADTLARARHRLGRARVGSEDWYWPADENPASRRWRPDERVRLLTPFDPIVHDRQRFERLWGWRYRFEAYTPPAKRALGYYALPLLWGDQVIGWGNLSIDRGELRHSFGYVAGRAPAEARFREELAAELERMRVFLGIAG